MLRERAELVWNGILDLVYPPCCLLCGVKLESGALCTLCRKDMTPLSPPFCDRCGAPAPAGEIVCPHCAEGPEPPFAWSQAVCPYRGTMRRAIHRLKYDGRAALAEPLGEMLAEHMRRHPSPLFPPQSDENTPAFDLVVPIPLHSSRFRQRGFNQAERIARVVAREFDRQLEPTGLVRVRATGSQTRLSLEERAANMRGAFAASRHVGYTGKSVLLVDDVLTTTATTREAAQVLLEAGARRVCVVALARG